MGKLSLAGDYNSSEFDQLQKAADQISEEAGSLLLDRRAQPARLQSDLGFHLQYDFDNNRSDYKRTSKGFKEPLARALGLGRDVSRVIDLTMGLAIDSVFLSQYGLPIISVERNYILHFLAQEGQRVSQRPEVKAIQFVHNEALSFLKQHQVSHKEVAYFDPMYPEKKKKSALPRQEMQFFKRLVGADQDAADVLLQALEMDFFRVVVKRPLASTALVGKPSYQIATKLVRYDVYQRRMES